MNAARGVALVATAGILLFWFRTAATAAVLDCSDAAPRRMSEDCRARDDVRSYAQAAKDAILEAWQPPSGIEPGRHVVKMRFQVAADGALEDLCASEGARSPAAPAAFEAFARAGRIAKPSADVAACIEDRDMTATFDLLVDSDDR